MIIFGSIDPDVDGVAKEIDSNVFWLLWDQYKNINARVAVDKDAMEQEAQDFVDMVQTQHGHDVFDCLNLMADLGGRGPGCMLDKDGKEVAGVDPHQFFNEHMYLVLNGEGPLYVITHGYDEAETLYQEVNATF